MIVVGGLSLVVLLIVMILFHVYGGIPVPP